METAKVPAAVAAAAEELGIDLTQEAAKLWRNHPALVKLSEDMADPQQLPAGWSAHLDPMYNRFFYVDEATGTSVWQHPLHNYFMGAVFMARDGSHMLEENQKHHPPNDEEVEEMARYLGIQPEDPPAVREVARMAVCAPLPPGWEQYDLDGYDGYRNTGTGEEQEAHPLDDYFAELVRKDLWADQAASGSGTSTPGAGSGAKVSFRFDAVLDEGSKTAALYESCVRDIVRSALKGINGTVLAYGQTGSGKTHTIMGHRNDPGVIAMAIDGIFAVLGSAVDEYSMKVDMLEIYNEDLRDLLAEPTEHLSKCRQLHIKEDAMHGVTVSGLYEEPVNDPVRMKQLLERGNSRRQTSSHRMNHISSRSHALYQIAIERKRVHAGHAAQVSVLNFVDLAGSERLEKSGNENEVLRARESVNINLSLLMLGNVISKLAELGSAAHTTTATQSFVPYRNSKLTRILQPSLGGNARTAVIATINPSVNQAEETSHTLRFAARAMAVTNLVSVNKVITDGDLAKQYRHEADDLRRRLRLQRGGQDPYEDIHMLQSKLARLEDRNMSLQLQLESVTGRPADVRDSLPPTPPGLNLPAMHVRKGGEPLTADKALKMISRVAALSRGLNRNLGLYGAATPEAIVQAVRKMRAERDQLRWRDRDHRERLQDLQSELTELDEFRKDWPLLEEAVKVMEDLTGGRAAGVANSLPERLKDAVETAAMLSAELSSLERQHSTVALLLAQEQSRAKALQEDNTAMKAAVASASALQSSVARLTDENAALRKHKGAAGVAVPGEAALKMVDVMEKQVANMQARLDAHENDREALKSRLAELAGIATPEQAGGLSASSSAPTGANASPETTPRQQTPQQRAQNPSQPLVGSAAVRQARAAHARAKVAEVQLAKALAERDALSQKLAQLQPAKEPDSEKSGDSEDENDAIMQRLKQRVYTLSKEVATLKHWPPYSAQSLPLNGASGLALIPEKPKAAQGWVDPNDSGDPKLREIEALRKRLVAAERARADVVAKVAAEKRIVQMQLQGAQKAAMQAATLDKQLQEWEAKMAQTAHISEAMRAERDATAAQLQMMAEENARLRAGMEQISTHLQLSTVSGAGQAS
ncbi:hypothetical protein WJX72_011447 [[Myrmecia] bisecta]|uniref:Kinesin-like protein n=1 Tax=[Myrmecia] bisecta TaxID=41462 RepID=A0AAW1NYK6_9CHLO